MINWREKFLAFAIHFLATSLLGAVAASLIFFVWFPHPFETMIGGTELFLLVVGCDLALGPLCSLVIYNSRKTRRALVIDYTVVGVLQIVAMIYGVYVVAGTRPVYVVFSTDRLEVVTARDIDESELAAAKDPAYRKLSLTGPRYVSVKVPKEDRSDALFQSLAGREEHQRPKFFVPYDVQLALIRKRARPVSAIIRKVPNAAGQFEAATRELTIPAERVATLPVRHRNGFWTALIDTETGRPVSYVAVDPFGE